MAELDRFRQLNTDDSDARRSMYNRFYWRSEEAARRSRDVAESKPSQRKRIALYRRIIGGGHRAILEIGCASGGLTSALADLASQTIGIDISSNLVRVAQQAERALPGKSVSFVQMNAIELGFAPSTFDFAVSSSMIEHLHPDDIDTHLCDVFRVLRDGGAYLVWCPNRLGHHKHRNFHLCMMSYCDLIERMKRAGFSRFRTPMFKSVPMVDAGFKVAMENAMTAVRLKVLWSHLGVRNICLVGFKDGPGGGRRGVRAAVALSGPRCGSGCQDSSTGPQQAPMALNL